MKKEWKQLSLEILDVKMTMKFWPPKGPKDPKPGDPKDPTPDLDS